MENHQAADHKISPSVQLHFHNYSPTAVLVTDSQPSFGTLHCRGATTPAQWLLPPTLSDAGDVVSWNILAGVTPDQAATIVGNPSGYGVSCTFQVSDILNQVTDTHRIAFRFNAIIIDGSRYRLDSNNIPIQSEHGGIGLVERRNREL